MLMDKENHEIKICKTPNPHILILGKSGEGKTYFCCRKIEEEIQDGKSVLIFDYSKSYSLPELHKCKFRYSESVRIFNPLEKRTDFIFGMDRIESALVDSFVNALRILSYYQKKLLREAIFRVVDSTDSLTIPALIECLEEMLSEMISSESEKNIGHLLTRLGPYSELDNIRIMTGNPTYNIGTDANVTIIQFSDFPELQRIFLTEFLAEMLWREVRNGYKKVDIVLFDEFHNMQITPGSALSAMLREGRKFGMGVYLSSQFLGNYNRDAVDTLMQAGNMFFFRPVQREMKFIASLIDPDEIPAWRKILQSLQVGEAVLKGRYNLNGNTREIETPIICKVESI
ncbi:ATP-binding protein [Clostridium sp. Marseille-P3244]|uniref:ATP-binding protein n=1 Tax=Clostridium sp. Marseille-P3244 TaxID=1871020 RepID=UPI0009303559|nr:DUF87 domain-containing protein [Clostridium sp. Marseille-P3244]